MALKMRLARAGTKKRPYYQIVVAEATAPRDGRFKEKVGTYNPLLPREHEDRIRLFEDRIKHWLAVGVQPTERVARFLGEAKLIEMPKTTEHLTKSPPKAKALERIREKEEKAQAAIEAAKAAKEEAKAAAEAEKEAAKEAAATPAEEPAEEAPAEEEAPVEETAPAEEAAPVEETKEEDKAES
jgi:small subunit ribosomal protein S16